MREQPTNKENAMPEIREGSVTVVLSDSIEVPANAGKLSPDEVRLVPKTRPGLGLACAQAATEMQKRGSEFAVPGVTAEELRRRGEQAELIDEAIEDVGIIYATLKQANLIIDAAAQELLGKVNDQVNVLGKHDPSIVARFSAVTEYFAKKSAKPAKPAKPATEA